jgi:hypothetical protein
VEYVFEEGKLFYNSTTHEAFHTIPHLIEVVLDFKGFITGCIAKEDEVLEGHTKIQQFEFFINSSGCSMMGYRIHYSDDERLPKEGDGIKLWPEGVERRPL